MLASFALEPHHLAVLGAACEANDRMREAQATIARDGAYLDGRYGLRTHPAVAVERDSRLAMLRSFRELGLDIEVPSGRQRTEAARSARWS